MALVTHPQDHRRGRRDAVIAAAEEFASAQGTAS